MNNDDKTPLGRPRLQINWPGIGPLPLDALFQSRVQALESVAIRTHKLTGLSLTMSMCAECVMAQRQTIWSLEGLVILALVQDTCEQEVRTSSTEGA